MKIAICSLSSFSHVSEFVDAAVLLNQLHEVRYFGGAITKKAATILQSSELHYSNCFRQGKALNQLKPLSRSENTDEIFTEYFFKHAELSLCSLIDQLRLWKPNVIISHLRDYAGITAAELLDIPCISFGSHQSPSRQPDIDPPFGAGISMHASSRSKNIAWKLQQHFNHRVDAIFNQTIRHPFGLKQISNVATLHSKLLTLLSIPKVLSNKASPEPGYIKFVGKLYSHKFLPSLTEISILTRIENTDNIKIVVALGGSYSERLMPNVVNTLRSLSYSYVIAGDLNKSAIPFDDPNFLGAHFFTDIPRLLESADLIITTGAAKSILEGLAAGKTMICLPCQGEQEENTIPLDETGCVVKFSPENWCSERFASTIKMAVSNPVYRENSSILSQQLTTNSQLAVDLILETIYKQKNLQ